MNHAQFWIILTSLDYETDEFVNLGIQRNGQSDSDLVQMSKSWKNVLPTGLELAIQYDLDVTDFVGLIRKDSSSHFMYSLALDSMESVPINLVISFDISNSMAGQRKVIIRKRRTFRDLKIVTWPRLHCKYDRKRLIQVMDAINWRILPNLGPKDRFWIQDSFQKNFITENYFWLLWFQNWKGVSQKLFWIR